jgi:hypothetical protein
MTGAGKRAVVTGAASGIGLAVALRLLREGASVVAADRNEAGLATVVEAGATPFVGDLAVDVVRDRLVEVGAGVDLLVNAAGIIRLKPILEVTAQDIRDIYAINVEATWDLVSRIGRAMPRGGAIVNLSSSSAKLATTTEAAVYASSKTAVLSLVRLRVGTQRRPGQRHLSRDHRHADAGAGPGRRGSRARDDDRGPVGGAQPDRATRPIRLGRRMRRGDPVPAVGRGRLHDRPGDQLHRGHGHLVSR